ncbi:MAG: hypothetical protein GC161_18315 [Planctomycetaceae bacterium]|nr:hypothetical protein [Planctomycetaceae bacterium]
MSGLCIDWPTSGPAHLAAIRRVEWAGAKWARLIRAHALREVLSHLPPRVPTRPVGFADVCAWPNVQRRLLDATQGLYGGAIETPLPIPPRLLFQAHEGEKRGSSWLESGTLRRMRTSLRELRAVEVALAQQVWQTAAVRAETALMRAKGELEACEINHPYVWDLPTGVAEEVEALERWRAVLSARMDKSSGQSGGARAALVDGPANPPTP